MPSCSRKSAVSLWLLAVPGLRAPRLTTLVDGFDSDDYRLFTRTRRDSPVPAPSADRVADLRRRSSRARVDLEIAIREDDFVNPAWHEREVPQAFAAKPRSPRASDVLGVREDLERQRPVIERGGLRSRASAPTAVCLDGLENCGRAVIRLDPPFRAATAHETPHRKLPARAPMLDVAVRKPKGEDRRCRDTPTVLRFGRAHRGNW